MTKLMSVLIAAGCFLFLVFGTVNSSTANLDNGDELIELLKPPRLADSFGVEPQQKNYSSDDEARALSIPRELFTSLNKYPFEVPDEKNRNYRLARGKYKSMSTGGINGWDHDTPFLMPIVAWKGGEPSVKQVDRDGYLVELNRYSDSEILGYFIKNKTAYVVLGLKGQTEFQIFELAWSDRELPYFNGYYFQISSDPIPDTRDLVFSSQFLKKLQARLFAN